MRLYTYKRFWSKVQINPVIRPGMKDECWEWTGSRKQLDGYGRVFICDGGSHYGTLAHRMSYEMMVGEIPCGMLVCHHCDNPVCVRPSHLFAGTAKDNAQDCIKKGRFHFHFHKGDTIIRVGTKNGRAKLTDKDVLEIRRLSRLNGKESVSELARRYRVQRSAIRAVIHGDTWKHLLTHSEEKVSGTTTVPSDR
jgi:hypothetical protein